MARISSSYPRIPKFDIKNTNAAESQSHWITPDNKIIEGNRGEEHEELLDKYATQLGFKSQEEYNKALEIAIKKNDPLILSAKAMKSGAIMVGKDQEATVIRANLEDRNIRNRVINLIDNNRDSETFIIDNPLTQEGPGRESFEGSAKQVIAQIRGVKKGSASDWHNAGQAVADVAKSPIGLMAGAETAGVAARGMQKQAENAQSGTNAKKDGGTIGQRNHNPGNLKATEKWEGMTGKDKYGHAIFKNDDFGRRALIKNLQNHKRKNPNQTLKQYMNSYAEKNGTSEAEHIAKHLKIDINTPMKDINVYRMAEYISSFESKMKTTDEDISRVRKEYKI